MRMVPRIVGSALLIAALVVATGCVSVGSSPSAPPVASGFTRAELPVTRPVPSSGGAPAFVVAEAARPSIGVFHAAGDAAPVLQLANPTEDGAPRVFLVLQGGTDWLHVLLPVRPNETTGWVRRSDVVLKADPYGVRVELGRHRLTVWRGSRLVAEEPAGVGRSVTGTPKGVYFVTALLRPPDPHGPYGPYAFGTSAFSPNPNAMPGGNGVIGIHGTDDPAGVGKDVSHGCIRLQNDAITRLAGVLPLGTPVFITP